MVARFRASGRSGFYLSVAREGELRAGDAIARLERGTGPTIPEMLADYNAMQTRIALPRPIADEFDPEHAGYVARVEAIADAGGALELQRDRVVARLSRLSGEQAAFRYAPGKWSVTAGRRDICRISSGCLRIADAHRARRRHAAARLDENVVMRGAAFDRRAHADVLERVGDRAECDGIAGARYAVGGMGTLRPRERSPRHDAGARVRHPRPRRAPPRSARRALQHPRVTQRAGLIQRGDVIGGGASLYFAYFPSATPRT